MNWVYCNSDKRSRNVNRGHKLQGAHNASQSDSGNCAHTVSGGTQVGKTSSKACEECKRKGAIWRKRDGIGNGLGYTHVHLCAQANRIEANQGIEEILKWNTASKKPDRPVTRDRSLAFCSVAKRICMPPCPAETREVFYTFERAASGSLFIWFDSDGIDPTTRYGIEDFAVDACVYLDGLMSLFRKMEREKGLHRTLLYSHFGHMHCAAWGRTENAQAQIGCASTAWRKQLFSYQMNFVSS